MGDTAPTVLLLDDYIAALQKLSAQGLGHLPVVVFEEDGLEFAPAPTVVKRAQVNLNQFSYRVTDALVLNG